MSHLEDLLGKELIGKDGNAVSVSSLEDNELLGIYFSAHWYNTCRDFTPLLVDCYKKVTADGKKWVIIFISLDKDEETCKQHYESMPWLLFPFESDLKDKNENKSENLATKFEVTEIPTLLLLDPKTGDLITGCGQDLVEKDPNGDKFPWK